MPDESGKISIFGVTLDRVPMPVMVAVIGVLLAGAIVHEDGRGFRRFGIQASFRRGTASGAAIGSKSGGVGLTAIQAARMCNSSTS